MEIKKLTREDLLIKLTKCEESNNRLRLEDERIRREFSIALNVLGIGRGDYGYVKNIEILSWEQIFTEFGRLREVYLQKKEREHILKLEQINADLKEQLQNK